MASARGSPSRPVVSRVKLPQPGRGQVRVADITAGSGCADPSSRSGSARSLAARSVPTPVLDSSPGPAIARRVRTPELRHGKTLESIQSLHTSMHRSNSENVLVRSLQRTESSHAGREEDAIASNPGSTSAELRSTHGFEASLPAASVWNPLPAGDWPEFEVISGDVSSAAGYQPSPRAKVRTTDMTTDTPPVSRCAKDQPPMGPSQAQPYPRNLPRSSSNISRDSGRQRKPPSWQASRRSNSRPIRASSKERPQSEPPQASGQQSRLPELLGEIEDHFLQQTVRPPADANGWLQETAQLEIYAEEMRSLLQTLEAPPGPSEPHQPGRSASNRPRARGARAVNAKPVREFSVLRGDKELRWARQQLKNCEREYQHLQQLLGSSEKELLEELRQVQESLEQEKRKVKHLERESHKRERSMARVAARAGGGELGVLVADGTALAMREVERLEGELEVYQMKNSSLMKQVESENHRLQQALQGLENQSAKCQALNERLESEDTKKRLADERQHQDIQQREEDRLRAEIRHLQEARRISARNAERSLKERQRRLEELRQKQAVHEGHLLQLKASEQQLRRRSGAVPPVPSAVPGPSAAARRAARRDSREVAKAVADQTLLPAPARSMAEPSAGPHASPCQAAQWLPEAQEQLSEAHPVQGTGDSEDAEASVKGPDDLNDASPEAVERCSENSETSPKKMDALSQGLAGGYDERLEGEIPSDTSAVDDVDSKDALEEDEEPQAVKSKAATVEDESPQDGMEEEMGGNGEDAETADDGGDLPAEAGGPRS